MSEAVQALEALLHDQPHNPLRPNQIEEYHKELDRLGALANSRDIDGQPRAWVPADRGAAMQTARRIQKILNEQAPKRVEEPLRRDQIAQRVKEVIETVIRPAMLPTEVMRRNPAGAVDGFMKRENTRPYKRAVLAVKRGLFALEQPDIGEPDYANLEKFRPSIMPDGVSTFMAEAQIPGKFAMSPQAKANWPLAEPTTTALAQAQRLETQSAFVQPVSTAVNTADVRETMKPKKKVKPKVVRSPAERKAWGEKMRLAREAKRAGTSQPPPESP